MWLELLNLNVLPCYCHNRHFHIGIDKISHIPRISINTILQYYTNKCLRYYMDNCVVRPALLYLFSKMAKPCKHENPPPKFRIARCEGDNSNFKITTTLLRITLVGKFRHGLRRQLHKL